MGWWMDRGAWRKLCLGTIVALIALGLDLAAAGRSRAATVTDAGFRRQGDIFTLQLEVRGWLRWVVSPRDNRLQIDLLNTRVAAPARQSFDGTAGPVRAVELSAVAGDRVRVLIDVIGRADFVVGRKGDDLIVRLAPAGANANLAAVFAPAPVARRQARRSARAPKIASARVVPGIGNAPTAPAAVRAENAPASAPIVAPQPGQGRPVVVVDAGHGGHDPGTRSEDGVLEKDLALQIALRLGQALSQRGFNAVLTRDRDEFLSLAQRTAIANRLAADLFVSIHLNWSPNSQTTGMEVYYLNNTTDRATIRLARMENAADDGRAPLDPSLNYILSDLRQQYKATESSLLAEVMEQQTVNELQAGFGSEIRGLGAKKGPFYVLVGPRIPAVLVECGFLSNSVEARRLAAPAYQQALADGLATAVARYLNQDVTAGTL